MKYAEITERLNKLVYWKAHNPKDFSDQLGYDRPQTVYNYMSGKTAPSIEFICKVLDKWPDISAEWLLRGVGGMERKIEKAPSPGALKSISEIQADFEILKRQMREIQKKI